VSDFLVTVQLDYPLPTTHYPLPTTWTVPFRLDTHLGLGFFVLLYCFEFYGTAVARA
jgi:hypothetical protein